jgi:NAD(P)-dependent dehydrogenase (short-subunit alcohol dehydrogenase family)
MKIVIVGASGTIGAALSAHLQSQGHTVIGISKNSADIKVDMTDVKSMHEAFSQIGRFDALVVTAGTVAFNTFPNMSEQEWKLSLDNKLMGQVLLSQVALNYLSPKGSITLTSGVSSRDCIPQGCASTMVNGALEHFVMAASLEMPNNLRINIVNPTILEESVEQYGEFFPGFAPVESQKVVMGYVKSICGVLNGQTIQVFH